MTPRPRRLLAGVAPVVLVIALVSGSRLIARAEEPVSSPPLKSTLPVPIRLVDPPIRDSLRRRCEPGYSMVRVKIDLRGYVTQAQLLKGFPVSRCVDSSDARRIDELAVAVTRDWAFLPATSGGMPHSMLVDLPVYVPTDTVHVPRHDGTLFGTVVDASTGAPIPGVRVTLEGSHLWTRTDRNGVFRIDHLVRLQAPLSTELMRFLPDTVLADVVPGRVDTLRLRLRPNPLAVPDSTGTPR